MPAPLPPNSSSPNAKRRRNEPLKALNVRARPGTPQQSTSSTPVTARPPAQPRQSLLPPKTVQKGDK
ncbi:unnamed protein product [Gongylonema pulchrum]|uniref:Uncharacterized protein n=1 Tax=Gongylonema pulchrum TaxID=637853 RepID=A0A183EXQ6_9BILA|nr:unnamed protein product [Gongylonema pulchrum]VDN44616.1 unnamed protein product [Gongylonema pulchrum]